jgi:hypothetical protein
VLIKIEHDMFSYSRHILGTVRVVPYSSLAAGVLGDREILDVPAS